MMDYNYHTHTKRCGHATGDDEEYIARAIEGGVRRMGFSDHAPFAFPDGFESHYRVQMSEAPDYFSSLRALRERYAEKIDILIGFEMEYYPSFFDKMLENVKNLGAEYLILGQHYVSDERPSSIPSTKGTSDTELLKSYVDCVLDGMRSGVFSYVAHPDIIKFFGDEAIYREEMVKICDEALRLDIPLEINFLGIRAGRKYPNPIFWEIAGERGAPVTFGFDAHAPGDAFDGKSLKIAEEMVRDYRLNYIGEPKIIRLK